MRSPYWYPHGLYRVAGLDRLLLVMLGIDLTAGPLLTLLLFRPGKWRLKFDLTTIAVLQLDGRDGKPLCTLPSRR